MGFGEAAQGALRSLRKTWSKGIDEVAVTLIGLGPRGSFRRVGGEAIPELADSTIWASWTPFVPPRHTKPRGRDSLENQVRAELERRGLPGLVYLRISLPTRDESGTGSAPRFRHFMRTRQGKALQAPPGLYRVVLTLEARIAGPLCLGWGSHFGLGLFRPADEQQGSTFPENFP
jgi:CRISPR-associated protein Csb2